MSLDKILFIPSFSPPLKRQDLASASHRLLMAHLAVAGNPLFAVSDVEYHLPVPSYTAATLQWLGEHHSRDELFFILGRDAFLDMASWYRPQDILHAARLIVMSRPPELFQGIEQSPFVHLPGGFRCEGPSCLREIPLITGSKATLFSVTPLSVSARQIRQLRREGKSIKYLLPETVESYIIEQALYTEHSASPTAR